MFGEMYERMGRPRFANPFRRKVTVVFKTHWLNGTYAVTFKAGDTDVMDRICGVILAQLPYEPTALDISNMRKHPRLQLVDVF